jgi:DNA-directed RNA polymerase specialized sigma24 family protein
MPDQAGQYGATIRVSPMDQRGRSISPAVLMAAEEVSRRAMYHAERLLIDPAVAANVLEEAAATVSRRLEARNIQGSPVRDLESYLFRAFIRRLNRIKRRQLLMTEAVELQTFGSRMSWDPRRALDMKIFMDEFLMQCDPVKRDMVCRRLADCSWRQVAQAYGISAHAAESKFNQTLQKVRRKLGLK